MKAPTPYRSCTALRSRGGLVLHSARLRSTSYTGPDISPSAYRAGLYFAAARRAGSAARDAWVEVLVRDDDLEGANCAALAARFSRRGWTFRYDPIAGSYTASRPSGRLTLRVADTDPTVLHRRLLAADAAAR